MNGRGEAARSLKFRFATAALAGSLAACTAPGPAPDATIATLPVVQVGATPSSDGDYVVFFPAGFSFPVELDASGTLFAAETRVETRATLARDLYVYRYWASHDGATWKPSHELLGVKFDGGLDVKGLKVRISVDDGE